jgi:hypothetical protein
MLRPLALRGTLSIYVCPRIPSSSPFRNRMQIPGDVGGQRTLRPYWRNYFEQTDGLVWVVDSSDRMRTQDCRTELHDLLSEDVSYLQVLFHFVTHPATTAASRRLSPRVCQQAGHSRFHDSHRDSRRKSPLDTLQIFIDWLGSRCGVLAHLSFSTFDRYNLTNGR